MAITNHWQGGLTISCGEESHGLRVIGAGGCGHAAVSRAYETCVWILDARDVREEPSDEHRADERPIRREAVR